MGSKLRNEAAARSALDVQKGDGDADRSCHQITLQESHTERHQGEHHRYCEERGW